MRTALPWCAAWVLGSGCGPIAPTPGVDGTDTGEATTAGGPTSATGSSSAATSATGPGSTGPDPGTTGDSGGASTSEGGTTGATGSSSTGGLATTGAGTTGGDPCEGPEPPPVLTLYSDADLVGLETVRCAAAVYVHDTVSSLASLASLERVENSLTIDETAVALTNVDGLESLGRVGSLHLHGPALTSLAGLSGLTTVDEWLSVTNHSLVTLDGLDAVTTVGGYLSIGADWFFPEPPPAPLEDISALAGLTTVGNLRMGNNPKLTTLDAFHQVVDIPGEVRVVYHDGLVSLGGLNNLQSAGSFAVFGNPQLPTCDVEVLAAKLAPAPIFIAGNLPDTCWDQSGCAPMDGVGVGPCEAEVGYFWDGTTCNSDSGCSCAGAQCHARLGIEDCQLLFAGCN